MANQKTAQELSLIIDKAVTVPGSKKCPSLTLEKAFYFTGQTTKNRWWAPYPLAKISCQGFGVFLKIFC